jgi:hypothetical protein
MLRSICAGQFAEFGTMAAVMGRFFRVLLSAVLLLTGVPAWQHSHVHGDRPHSHHGHRHHELDGISRSRAHLHVTLLGVDFTLPVPSDDDDQSAQGQPTYVVGAPVVVDVAHAAQPVFPVKPGPDLGEPCRCEPVFRCKTALAAPLCDTARHERSGVQLI